MCAGRHHLDTTGGPVDPEEAGYRPRDPMGTAHLMYVRTGEHQVGLVMDVVVDDRDRPRPADHAALVGEEQQSGADGRGRHPGAGRSVPRLAASLERPHRAPADRDGGRGDQPDLE